MIFLFTLYLHQNEIVNTNKSGSKWQVYTSQKSTYSTKCECLSENFINNILVRATLIYSAFQL